MALLAPRWLANLEKYVLFPSLHKEPLQHWKVLTEARENPTLPEEFRVSEYAVAGSRSRARTKR